MFHRSGNARQCLTLVPNLTWDSHSSGVLFRLAYVLLYLCTLSSTEYEHWVFVNTEHPFQVMQLSAPTKWIQFWRSPSVWNLNAVVTTWYTAQTSRQARETVPAGAAWDILPNCSPIPANATGNERVWSHFQRHLSLQLRMDSDVILVDHRAFRFIKDIVWKTQVRASNSCVWKTNFIRFLVFDDLLHKLIGVKTFKYIRQVFQTLTFISDSNKVL